MHLSEEASNICTTIIPWRKYRYKRLPIGFSSSLDILQEKTNKMSHRFEFIRAYIDDLLIITDGDLSNQLAEVVREAAAT